jgi:hypothetical protein
MIGVIGGALIVFGIPYLSKKSPTLAEYVTGASIIGIGVISKGGSKKEILAGFANMAFALVGQPLKDPEAPNSSTTPSPSDILRRIQELKNEINQLGDSDNG